MEIIGKLIYKGETQTFGSNNFRKRDAAIETAEQYPQKIAVEFVQDKTDLLDNYKIGEEVKIGINIRGREWVSPQGETKYFNSLQAWRIDRVGGAPRSESAVDQHFAKSKPETAGDDFINGKFENPTLTQEEDDDLPF